jgi:hypothetical protein
MDSVLDVCIACIGSGNSCLHSAVLRCYFVWNNYGPGDDIGYRRSKFVCIILCSWLFLDRIVAYAIMEMHGQSMGRNNCNGENALGQVEINKPMIFELPILLDTYQNEWRIELCQSEQIRTPTSYFTLDFTLSTSRMHMQL